MNFWKDGIDITDFEKIILGFLFIGVVVIASIKYMFVGDVSSNWVTIIGLIGSLFVFRKAISYFKPVQYYENNSTEDTSNNDNNEGSI